MCFLRLSIDGCGHLRSTCVCNSTKSSDFAYSCYSSSFTSFLASIHCFSEPSSYKEAILDPRWQQAMDEELSPLHKTGTWNLVPLPLGKSVVSGRWGIRLRLILMDLLSDSKLGWLQKDIHNNTVWIMTRLLLLFTKLTIVRTLITLASVRQCCIFELYVKNAFLNGDLQEEVYMEPPYSNKHLVLGLRNFVL